MVCTFTPIIGVNVQTIDEVLAGVAVRQGGVVGRAQLLARGLDAKAIDYRVSVGRLRVIHRGVYAVGHDAIPVRGRLVAALLVAGPGSALSHRTAAHVLALLPSMPQFIEVTTTTRPPRSRPHLRFHRTTHLETARRHGLPVTTPIRTLLDLAAANDPDLERATSEAMVLDLVTQHDLRSQHGPGAKRLRDLIVGPTRSRLERAFLKSLDRHGLPEPIVAHRIGRWTVDFYWPSHALVLETDGDRYHDHPLARRRDQRKDAELRARGCTVVRVPEAAIADAPAAVRDLLSLPPSRTAS